ncbi:hypothetical protein NW759_002122 [Fusarium solani]|nr:hypothetical protein NW759_002122 [Fusarium solani]
MDMVHASRRLDITASSRACPARALSVRPGFHPILATRQAGDDDANRAPIPIPPIHTLSIPPLPSFHSLKDLPLLRLDLGLLRTCPPPLCLLHPSPNPAAHSHSPS